MHAFAPCVCICVCSALGDLFITQCVQELDQCSLVNVSWRVSRVCVNTLGERQRSHACEQMQCLS